MTMSCTTCDDLNVPSGKTIKPAIFSRLINFSGTLVNTLIQLRSNYKRRKRFIALLDYNDGMLEDMGLTRYLVEEAGKLPLKDNAAIIARDWARRE